MVTPTNPLTARELFRKQAEFLERVEEKKLADIAKSQLPALCQAKQERVKWVAQQALPSKPAEVEKKRKCNVEELTRLEAVKRRLDALETKKRSGQF